MTTIDKELAKLKPAVRETVLVIQSLYEQGKPYRYSDIQKERIERGMTDGSLSTIREAKQEWPRIYNIAIENYNTPKQVEVLTKRIIEDIRDAVKVQYEQEADARVAAAEEQSDVLTTQLQKIERRCAEHEKQIEILETHNHHLKIGLNDLNTDYDTLKQENQQLGVEAGKLMLKLNASDAANQKLEQEIKQREMTISGLQEAMELQRQSQLQVIDDWRQEAKKANRFAEKIMEKVEKSEEAVLQLKLKLAKTEEHNQLLREELERTLTHVESRKNDFEEEFKLIIAENKKLLNENVRLKTEVASLNKNERHFLDEILSNFKKLERSNKDLKEKKRS
jgi:chromosome segregation ATPase